MEKMKKESRKTVWVLCPSCGEKTRTKIHRDTVLVRFPLSDSRCIVQNARKSTGEEVFLTVTSWSIRAARTKRIRKYGI